MNSSSTHYDSISYKSQTQSKKKYKIILLGDSGVGKTSIISRFIDGKFQPKYDPTIGIDFLVKNMTYQGTTIRVQLWDTAGQQKFKSLIPSYLKDAAAAIFVFDLQKPQSLKNLQEWISMFRDHNFHPLGPKSMVGIICGNKSDIEKQKLDKDKLYELMDRYKFPFQSVSAMTGSNIEELFYLILQTIVTKQKESIIKKRKNMEKIQSKIQPNQNQNQGGQTDRMPQTQVRLKNKNRSQNQNNQENSKDSKNIQLTKQKAKQKNNCAC